MEIQPYLVEKYETGVRVTVPDPVSVIAHRGRTMYMPNVSIKQMDNANRAYCNGAPAFLAYNFLTPSEYTFLTTGMWDVEVSALLSLDDEHE
jgi:hypothetical protein